MPSPPTAELKPRQFLAVSLLLLYVAFIFLGWQWSTLQPSWRSHWIMASYPQFFWPTGILATLAATGLFTRPPYVLRRRARQLFSSDTRLFFAVILMTSLGVLLLVNLAILAEALLVLGVIWLARFDLRLIKVRGWKQFVLLGTVALLGFLGGGWLHWGWLHHGFPWVQEWLKQSGWAN